MSSGRNYAPSSHLKNRKWGVQQKTIDGSLTGSCGFCQQKHRGVICRSDTVLMGPYPAVFIDGDKQDLATCPGSVAATG